MVPVVPGVTVVTACTSCSSRVHADCIAYVNGKNMGQEGTGLTAEDVCPEGSTQLPLCTGCADGTYLVGGGLLCWRAVALVASYVICHICMDPLDMHAAGPGACSEGTLTPMS